MRIGLICAMKEEFELVSREFKLEKSITKSSLEFLIGDIEGKNIVGVICGIGKVNAAICTQILISEFKCDIILNSGVAGSIDPSVNFKDVIIARDLIEHDVDVTHFGYKLGEIPNIGTCEFKSDEGLVRLAEKICLNISNKNNNFKFHTGRIVTGDQFISNSLKCEKLKNTFNALACEMESASIAHTCYLNNIKFLIIRSISDNGGTIAGEEFSRFLKESSKNSYLIIKETIKNIN